MPENTFSTKTSFTCGLAAAEGKQIPTRPRFATLLYFYPATRQFYYSSTYTAYDFSLDICFLLHFKSNGEIISARGKREAGYGRSCYGLLLLAAHCKQPEASQSVAFDIRIGGWGIKTMKIYPPAYRRRGVATTPHPRIRT